MDKPLVGLSARDFFARDLEGCSMHAAHHGTQLAYSSVHDIAHGNTASPRIETLRKLEAWSRVAAAAFGVFISPAVTLGLDAPDAATDPSTAAA